MHIRALSKTRFSGGRIRLRGFTLVELAITLMVVGLLMSAALLPMRALEERRQLREEMRRLESARDAIVGYALRHRTRARMVKFTTGNPHTERTFHLPGGRPYLPCPDWDGDGFEDRYPEGANGFVQGMEVKPDLTITLTLRQGRRFTEGHGPTNISYLSLGWVRYFTPNSYTSVRPYGECVAGRGTVPWRTLGVEPSDRWGNRHTYFADPAFSNAIFGFDRQTIADLYDYRIPSAPGLELAPRHFNIACPSAICDGSRSANCWQHAHVARFGGLNQCAWGGVPSIFYTSSPPHPSPEEAEGRVLKAGAIITRGIPPTSDDKYYPEVSVNDGLPFVLVSHGPNGRFAVNHWATLQNPIDENGVLGPVCNLESNALPIISTGERGRIHEAVNGTRFGPGSRCPYVSWRFPDEDNPPRNTRSFNPSFFVWEPPGASDKSDFDDLLLWMTRDELAVEVRGHIPSLPRMSVPF